MHVELVNSNSYLSLNIMWPLMSTFQATKEKQSDLLAIARCNNLHWRTDFSTFRRLDSHPVSVIGKVKRAECTRNMRNNPNTMKMVKTTSLNQNSYD